MCTYEGQETIQGVIRQALSISFCMIEFLLVYLFLGLVWFCEIESLIGLELS